MIPYGRQSIDGHDIEAVVEVLKSDWLTQGPMVPRFEAKIAEIVGANCAVAVNSATSALHLACLALGVSPGDRVWTSPLTFVASANCAVYCGATVDFVDIDAKSYNMSPSALALKLEQAERSGTLPRVVIPVHFAGQSCEMQSIRELGQRYGFAIIEDASHAIGGKYCERPIGDCAFSEMTIFSFHPVKNITTGEGGVAVTNNAEYAEHMRMLRSHGITRDVTRLRAADQGHWYYEQHLLGFNYRMTDLQAALGLSQAVRLDEFIARRRQLAKMYTQGLAGLPLVLPWQNARCESAFHLYVVQLDRAGTAASRRLLVDRMRSNGIGVNVHYIPVHLQPFYRERGFRPGQFPITESYYENAVSLPLFPGLRDEELHLVVGALREAVTAL